MTSRLTLSPPHGDGTNSLVGGAFDLHFSPGWNLSEKDPACKGFGLFLPLHLDQHDPATQASVILLQIQSSHEWAVPRSSKAFLALALTQLYRW